MRRECIISLPDPVSDPVRGVAARYRMMLFADGEEAFAEDIHSGNAPDLREVKCVRKGFKRKDGKGVRQRNVSFV